MKGTSKLQSRHLSADRPLQRLRGCFLGDNAAVPPAYRVKVEKCASFVDILDVCKFTTFCDRKGYRLSRRVWRRFVRGSREISLVSSLRRTSTDALITDNKANCTWLTVLRRGHGSVSLSMCVATPPEILHSMETFFHLHK